MVIPLGPIGLIIDIIGAILLYKLITYIALNEIGLIINLIGAAFLAKPLWKTDSQIERLSIGLSGLTFDDNNISKKYSEKVLKEDRICGKIGILCLIIGFALQIIGGFL